MKNLLVVFLFTLSPQGNPDQFHVVTQVFENAEQCNYVGRNLRNLLAIEIPEEYKTLSYCVSAKDFAPKA